jgi:hypothetical protein
MGSEINEIVTEDTVRMKEETERSMKDLDGEISWTMTTERNIIL